MKKSITKNAALGISMVVIASSCATYHTKTANVETNLHNGNIQNAVADIDHNKFLSQPRNRLLYLMEKGKLECMMGNYQESNDFWEKAYTTIDDKIKTTAGKAIASNLTNPMAEPYKGEDFEKVTIHYYKALNYMAMGQPDEALVEAKRINIKLLEMNDKYPDNKNKYAQDAFAEILQGIIYETTGDINNAFIAYRNAANLYSANEGQYFGVPFPLQLKKDLLRTTSILGLTEEYNEYRDKFDMDYDKNTGRAEAILFWENGLGPVKDQVKITAAGNTFVGSYDDDNIVIPIPPGVNVGFSAIAIPKYNKREPDYQRASVEINGEEVPFELSEDYFTIARQCLRDRMMREAIKIALRFGTKKTVSKGLSFLAKQFLGSVGEEATKLGTDIAGAAVEKADTRNWGSLPATISYVRVPLHEGENKFVIRKYSNDGTDLDTVNISYKKGLQLISYFDVNRSTHFVVQAADKQNAGTARLEKFGQSLIKGNKEQP